MDIHRYLWSSIDIHWYLWNSLDIHRYLWIDIYDSTDIHRYQLNSIDIRRYLWNSADIHRYNSIDTHRYLWNSWDFHWYLWIDTYGILQISIDIIDIRPFWNLWIPRTLWINGSEDTNDYVARVEPSDPGGHKLAVALKDAILDERHGLVSVLGWVVRRKPGFFLRGSRKPIFLPGKTSQVFAPFTWYKTSLLPESVTVKFGVLCDFIWFHIGKDGEMMGDSWGF